jgi:hypothetical protein
MKDLMVTIRADKAEEATNGVTVGAPAVTA